MQNSKLETILSKKIGILGLGEENIALVNYLIKHGLTTLTICDQKGKDELKESLKQLNPANFQFRVGASYLDNLDDFDILFRSPGLPYLNPKIQEAKSRGVEISSAIKFFFDLSPALICGVTGTKGKGTTTTLIAKMLREADKDRKIYLAGNIGNSPLEFIDELQKDDIVILELSSFQLQDLYRSPHTVVVLDIKSDHLDYHQSREEYVDAKKNIVRFQTSEDVAIINADYETSREFGSLTPAQKYWFSRKKIIDQGAFVEKDTIYLQINRQKYEIVKTSEILLRGQHNLENICASLTAAYLLGANIDSIKQTIKQFKGLKHRLEFVGETQGIKFYNDSFSTTPETTIAAINSFSEPIILIAGGSEKNADYSDLGKIIVGSSVKTAILIGHTGPKIEASIMESVSTTKKKIKIINNCKNIDDVIEVVRAEMKPGDIVLLSPASASFDWFKNYKDRGERFISASKKIIDELK